MDYETCNSADDLVRVCDWWQYPFPTGSTCTPIFEEPQVIGSPYDHLLPERVVEMAHGLQHQRRCAQHVGEQMEKRVQRLEQQMAAQTLTDDERRKQVILDRIRRRKQLNEEK